MSLRARNVKPGFFQNDELANLSPWARLLFIGLWCFADREGRFEWRPTKIKACVFPYDDVDVECNLMSLHVITLIQKYEKNGIIYGFIPNFKQHQHPHPHEAKSIFPSIENSQVLETQCHEMPCNVIDKVSPCQADILNSKEYIPSVCERALPLEAIGLELMPTPPTRAKKALKPKGGPSIASVLDVGDEGKLANNYWVTAKFWDQTKNPRPREAAEVYRAIHDRGTDMIRVAMGAKAYYDAHMPPKRARDESHYMIGFKQWLESEGWESALREDC